MRPTMGPQHTQRRTLCSLGVSSAPGMPSLARSECTQFTLARALVCRESKAVSDFGAPSKCVRHCHAERDAVTWTGETETHGGLDVESLR
jgi:hypothetical protein